MILVNIINKNSTPEAPYLIIGSTDASKYNLIPPWNELISLGAMKWTWKYHFLLKNFTLNFKISGKLGDIDVGDGC